LSASLGVPAEACGKDSRADSQRNSSDIAGVVREPPLPEERCRP
jgi:hypothetical protein